jgi:hypothetical protein
MGSRITIYDKAGYCIAEVDAIVKRSWILNRFGVANFQLSTQDPKCRREIIEFGNYVLIEHEKIPSWCGMISVLPAQRQWKFGSVGIKCDSAERIFATRYGQDGKVWNSFCGYNFFELINFANIAADTRIRAGEVYLHGAPYTLALTYGSNLYDSITAMSDFYRHEWDVTPAWDVNGLLTFKANWYYQRSFPRETMLLEGKNIEMVDNVMTEQGEIVTQYRFTGSGINSADKSTFTATDMEAIRKYGLVQKSETGDLEDITGNVEKNAIVKLEKMKNPRRTFNFKVLDVENLWKEVSLGAIFPVKLHSAGFMGSGFGTEAWIRVTGMVFDDAGRLEITCEETTNG